MLSGSTIMLEGVQIAGLLLLGERVTVADLLVRYFARGFVRPTSILIALGMALTAEAALSLHEDGGTPAGSLDDVARLLDAVQPWALYSAAFHPTHLFLRGRLAALHGLHEEARPLLLLAAGHCAAAGLRYYEARCRYELRAFGGADQLREALRLFRACGAAGWVAAAEAALLLEGGASEPDPLGGAWNRLTCSEVAAVNAAYPGAGAHTQVYDGAALRAQLRGLADHFARLDAAARADVCGGLPASFHFVREQLRVPDSDPQVGYLLDVLEEGLPRLAEALRLGEGGGGGGGAVIAITLEAVAAVCAAAPAPARIPAGACLVCEVEAEAEGGCAPNHRCCLEAFALGAVTTLLANALMPMSHALT